LTGRFHLRVTLPDRREAIADYRDPIITRFHAIHRARALGEQPPATDLAAVVQWLDDHAAEVARCGRGECCHVA